MVVDDAEVENCLNNFFSNIVKNPEIPKYEVGDELHLNTNSHPTFQKCFSTQHCRVLMFERWENAFDNAKVFRTLLTDLSKAFGCGCHDFLIAKLNAYDLSLSALKPLHNYPQNRKQITKNCLAYGLWVSNIWTTSIRPPAVAERVLWNRVWPSVWLSVWLSVCLNPTSNYAWQGQIFWEKNIFPKKWAKWPQN